MDACEFVPAEYEININEFVVEFDNIFNDFVISLMHNHNKNPIIIIITTKYS